MRTRRGWKHTPSLSPSQNSARSQSSNSSLRGKLGNWGAIGRRKSSQSPLISPRPPRRIGYQFVYRADSRIAIDTVRVCTAKSNPPLLLLLHRHRDVRCRCKGGGGSGGREKGAEKRDLETCAKHAGKVWMNSGYAPGSGNRHPRAPTRGGRTRSTSAVDVYSPRATGVRQLGLSFVAN